MKDWCIRNRYSLLFITLLFCFYEYSVKELYGFVIFPDEFGYWTYAAKLAGYDWSNIVSLGSYYSFGYSLILYPIFMIFHNGVTAYRVAVTINMILIIISYFILRHLLQMLIKQEDGNTNISRIHIDLFAAIAMSYPSWLFYSKMTMTEVLVMCMYLVVCLTMYCYLRKGGWHNLCLCIISLIYLYTVHMRTVGVLVAAGLIFLMQAIKDKKKRKSYIGIILLFFLVYLCSIGKDQLMNVLYSSAIAGRLATNDYAGQVGKLERIFSLQGMTELTISIIGKILYLGLSTYGLFYWGIGYFIQKTYRIIKDFQKKKEISGKDEFYLFVLLASAGEVMVTSIYTMGRGRIDGYTYGRYNEQILPIIMGIGIYAIWKNNRVLAKVITICIFQAIMTGIVIYVMQLNHATDFRGYFMVGMCHLVELFPFKIARFYWGAYLFGSMLTIGFTISIKWGKKGKFIDYILISILFIQIILGFHASYALAHRFEQAAFRDYQLSNTIQEVKTEDRRLIYIKENDNTWVNILQFMMREEQIEVITPEEVDTLTQSDMIIVNHDGQEEVWETLKEQYQHEDHAGHFYLYWSD